MLVRTEGSSLEAPLGSHVASCSSAKAGALEVLSRVTVVIAVLLIWVPACVSSLLLS